MFTKQVHGYKLAVINYTLLVWLIKDHKYYVTGKLPIEVDMEAIPQELLDPDSELDAEILQSTATQDSPPLLPPKYSYSEFQQ